MATVDREASPAAPSAAATGVRTRASGWPRAALRVLATLAAVVIAAALGFFAWRAYMATPWTRDGTVRAYVVSIAPQVAGKIASLPVGDNQFVRKGDLLFEIDAASYAIAARQAEAGVLQAKALAQNAEAEWARRQKLNDLAVTVEEQQSYASKSLSANAQYQLALADLAGARLNLERTRVVSPVNGWVTNLLARAGDYANVGERQLAVIDADSFWVDAYFEETLLAEIHDGDAASIKLMGYPQILHGHVESIARGISVANATPSALGLATVNPIFAFVRLAQRIPVRIKLDAPPGDVRLVVGATATVAIEPGARRTAAAAPNAPKPSAAIAPGAPSRPHDPGAAPVRADAGALGPAAASAEAILPPLSMAGAMSGAGAATPTEQAAAARPAPAGAGPATPRTAPADAASSQASELLSDQTFDRTLDLVAPTGPAPQKAHAPETLRRRGARHWRRHEGE